MQTTKNRWVRWIYPFAARFKMLHLYHLTCVLCTEWVQITPSFNHSLIPHCNAGPLSGPQAEDLYSMESIESIGLFRTSIDDTAVPGTFFFSPLSFLFVSFFFFSPGITTISQKPCVVCWWEEPGPFPDQMWPPDPPNSPQHCLIRVPFIGVTATGPPTIGRMSSARISKWGRG